MKFNKKNNKASKHFKHYFKTTSRMEIFDWFISSLFPK